MLKRGFFRAAIVAAVSFFLSQSGQAMEISRSGTTLNVSGVIYAGDDLAFRDAVAQAPTRAVRLNSPGGFVTTAGEIGRIIREKNLTTVVDASRAECVSACTLLFASGTTRLYINADRLSEGTMSFGGFTGLGYHEGSTAMSLDANGYSGEGTAEMIDYYYEFGSSRAADLITKAPPNRLYRVSGQTAVAMGLATGTSYR